MLHSAIILWGAACGLLVMLFGAEWLVGAVREWRQYRRIMREWRQDAIRKHEGRRHADDNNV